MNDNSNNNKQNNIVEPIPVNVTKPVNNVVEPTPVNNVVEPTPVNNVVEPTPVNINTQNTNTEPQPVTYLNRERDNIIQATNMVNSVTEKDKTIEVNNQYKIKKESTLKKFITYTFFIMLILVFIILIFKLIKKLDDKLFNDTTTTTIVTTTTTTKADIIKEYIKNYGIVRKFQGSLENKDEYILLFLPYGYNAEEPAKRELLFLQTRNNKEIVDKSMATYDIKTDNISIKTESNKFIELKITEDGLQVGNSNSYLKISDYEMKYYTYEKNNDKRILLLNGTPQREFALYITNNGQKSNYVKTTYTEDANNIKLKTGLNFSKLNTGNVKIGDIELTLHM